MLSLKGEDGKEGRKDGKERGKERGSVAFSAGFYFGFLSFLQISKLKQHQCLYVVGKGEDRKEGGKARGHSESVSRCNP